MAAQATTRTKPAANRAKGHTYSELVANHPLRPIRSEAALGRAIAVLNELIDRERVSKASRDELDYQQALAILIGHYEADHEPVAKVTPADMLRHLLDARGITQSKFASDTGASESTVSEILAGKRPVSTKNRRLFSESLKVDPAVFV